jgi:hypothetical protein
MTTPALARGGAVQATDPNANSPAGVVYSIPLDSARQDASPHGHGGSSSSSGGPIVGGGSGGSGGGGGIAGGSGSGSVGSGGSGGAGAGSGAGSSSHSLITDRGTTTPILVPGGQPASLIHSSNGFGSSSKVPGAGSPASAGLGAVQSNASSAPLLAFLLAAVVLTLGGFAGVRAWRTGGRRGPPPDRRDPPQLPAGS